MFSPELTLDWCSVKVCESRVSDTHNGFPHERHKSPHHQPLTFVLVEARADCDGCQDSLCCFVRLDCFLSDDDVIALAGGIKNSKKLRTLRLIGSIPKFSLTLLFNAHKYV